MKILIITYGTRGDVQPYIAIGQELQESGHQVTLGTSERFRDCVEEQGLKYGQLSDELLAIIDTDQGRDLLENTTTIFDAIKQNIKLSKKNQAVVRRPDARDMGNRQGRKTRLHPLSSESQLRTAYCGEIKHKLCAC